MRGSFWFFVTALFLGLWLIQTQPGELNASGKNGVVKEIEDTEGGCGQFGTSVNFVETPSVAARQALKEEKLVFVLHVSGLFENPEFT